MKEENERLLHIRRPGIMAALKEICAGVPRQQVHDKYGSRDFERAFKMWMKGERA